LTLMKARCSQGVGAPQVRRMNDRHRETADVLGRQNGVSPLIERRLNEASAIRLRSRQGREQKSGRHLSTVRRHTCDDRIGEGGQKSKI
jgi:hypothetical protein